MIQPETATPPSNSQAPASTGPNSVAIVLGIALVVLVAALCVNPTPESDLFWQLRTGEWIVAHHAPPHSDMYSWTRPGTPWIAHEWLSFAIFWSMYHVASFGGLYLYTAAVVSTLFALMFIVLVRRTQAPLTSFLLTAGAAVVSSPFFQPRPQLATYLFSVITLTAVLWARNQLLNRRPVAKFFFLIPLYALWANLHAGVLVGIAVLGVFTVCSAVEDLMRRDGQSGLWRPLLLATVGCFAATLATPYGYHEYENILHTVSNSTAMNLVAEWASPDFHQAYGKQVELLLIVIAYGMFFTTRRRNLGETVLLLVLIHEALAANRNVPLLAMMGMIVAAPHIQSAATRHLYRSADAPVDGFLGKMPPSTFAFLIAFAAAFFGIAQASGSVRAFGGTEGSTLERIGRTVVVYDSYPSKACDFIEAEQFPSTMHMYNIYGDGGFLLWRMPRRPVFIDSRADVYFGKVLEDYRRLNVMNYGWRDILSSYGADMIVVSASERQVQQYLPANDWALVYVDDSDLSNHDDAVANTLIFIKREPQYAGLIARCRHDCRAFAGLRRYAAWGAVH